MSCHVFIEVKKKLFCPNDDEARAVDNVVSGMFSVVDSIPPVTLAARVEFTVMAGMVYL